MSGVGRRSGAQASRCLVGYQYTIDNGSTWTDVASSQVDAANHTLTLTGLTLSNSPDIQVRAVDALGNATGTLVRQAISYDNQAPNLPAFNNLALSADTGKAGDFITNTAAQTITATLSASLASGDKLYGSTNGGASWSDLSSFLSDKTLNWSGQTLSGTSSIQFKIRDAAGNDTNVFKQDYVLDTTASNMLRYVDLSASTDVSANQVVEGVGAEAGAQVQLLSDGQVIAEDTALADGSFSFTLPQQDAGTHSLSLRYTDLANNTSNQTATQNQNWVAGSAMLAPARLTGLALSADTDSGRSQTDGVTNVAAAKFTGAGAQAGATVQISKVTSDNNTLTYTALNTTATVQQDGTWTLTLSGADVLSADTTFVVRQKAPGATTWSPYSSQYQVKFDNTAATSAPTLVLDAASDSAGVSNSDGITKLRNLKLTGQAEANAWVEIWDNGAKVATVTADASTGAWQTTLINVSEGAHNYKARQVDVAGNTSAFSEERSVLVDATILTPNAPVLDLASDSGTQGDNLTTVVRPVLTGSGAEAGATLTVFDGVNSLGTTTVKADGTWAFTPSADLSVGIHLLRVSQTDVAGNSSSLSNALSLTILAPVTVATPSAPVLATASDTGVSQTDGITSATSLTFTGTGALAGGKVELWQGDIKFGEVTTASAGTWSLTLTNLNEGANQLIKARVVDVQGNASAYSAQTTFTLDRTAPLSVLSLSPLAATEDTGRSGTDGLTNKTAPVISGRGASANARVNIYNVGTLLTTLQADGNGNFTGPVSLMGISGMTFRLSAAEVDAAGNVGAKYGSLTVTVDKEVSTPTLTTTGLSTLVGNPTLTGTGAEANALIELFDGTGAAAVASGYANADGTWALQYKQANTGTYALSVRQTDVAGNVSSLSAAVNATIGAGTAAAVLPSQLLAPTIKLGEDLGTNTLDGITSKTAPVIVIRGVDASIDSTNVATSLKVYDGATLLTGTFNENGGTWEFTPSAALSASVAGTAHTLSVTQTVGGNTSLLSAPVSLIVDSGAAAPTVGVIPTGTTVYDGARIASVTGGPSGYKTGSIGLTPDNTVSVWGKLDAASLTVAENQYLFSSLQTAYLIYYAGMLMIKSGDAWHLADFKVDADWHNFVVVSKGTNISLYVDGVQVAIEGAKSFTANSGFGATTAFTSTTFTIGNHPSEPRSFKGVIANFKAWDEVLTERDIANVYANQSTSQDASLVAAYSLLGSTTAQVGPALTSLGATAPTLSTGAVTTFNMDLVTNSSTVKAQPVLTGRGEVNATIELFDDGNLMGTTTVKADGTWSFQALGLTSGQHSITVKQTDVAGNVSNASSAYSFTVTEVVAPSAPPSALRLATASDTGPDTTDGITKLTSVTVQGSATAAGDTIEVFVVTANSNYQLVGSTTVAADGTWSVSGVNLTANASTDIVARAKNTAGSSGYSAALHVVSDTFAPAALTVSLAATSDTGVQGDNRTSQSAVTLTGTTEAGASITISRGGSTVGTATADATTGQWTAALTAALSSNTSNVFTITAMDKAGNTLVNTTYTVVHDSVAPSSTLALTSGSSYGLMPTLSGNGAEASAFVDIYAGNTLVGTTQASASGVWSVQLASLTTAGSFALTAKQRDAADNLSQTASTFNVTLSAAVPVQANRAPTLLNASLVAADDTGSSSTDGITSLTQPRLTGTGAQAAATIEAWEGSTLIGSTTADSSGNWTLTPSAAFTSGSHALNLTQRGNGQNTSSPMAYTLTVANVVAAPTIGSVAGDGVISLSEVIGATATATGTCLSGATVSVIFTGSNGNSVTKTATVTGTNWTIPTLSSADMVTLGGTGNISVSAKQVLGGFSSAPTTTSVRADMTVAAPVISSVAGDGTISLSEVKGAAATATGTCLTGATVSVIFTGSNGASITKTATVTGTNWTSATLTSVDIAALGGGGNSNVSISVTAKQVLAGLSSSPSAATSATIDTSFVPTTAIAINTGIATNDVINASETPTISGTATKGATVNVTLTNTTTQASVTLSAVTADANSGVWTTAALTAQQVSTLGGDNQNLVVMATQTDAATGASSSVSRTIVIDTVAPATAPTIALAKSYTDSNNVTVAASDSGVVGDNLTNVTTPTLTGKADAFSSVNIYNKAGALQTTVNADANGNWLWKLGTALANGSTTAFTAKQVDAAGNVGVTSSTLSVTVDTAMSAPTVIPACQ